MKLLPKTYKGETKILGWNSDDEAQLYWYASAGSGDPLQPPASMTAFKIGHSGVERGELREIQFEHLNFIGAGLFGPGRQSLGGTSKWTGNSHRYGIYTCSTSKFSDETVIIQMHGGGIYAYILEDIDAAKTWRHLCTVLDQPTLWDLCDSICETYNKGVRDGKTTMRRLFLDGRLKRRKKRGAIFCDIIPPAGSNQIHV